jgi:hypothetical protein
MSLAPQVGEVVLLVHRQLASAMRKLKHHEQKLLKKVDFLRWKSEHNQRELQVCDSMLLKGAILQSARQQTLLPPN